MKKYKTQEQIEKQAAGCQNKESFDTWQAANRIVIQMRKRHKCKIKQYKCRFCNKYHIGRS